MDALRAMVNNPLKEIFIRKKNVINVLTTFSISHKVVSKLSLNGLLTITLRALVSMTLYIQLNIIVRHLMSYYLLK